uniref:TSG101 and ALIX binding domain-containing protein n=1 Tax=Knipowitschia caucasica TaxID=637954 RepID=A0AAV2JI71_KNICA
MIASSGLSSLGWPTPGPSGAQEEEALYISELCQHSGARYVSKWSIDQTMRQSRPRDRPTQEHSPLPQGSLPSLRALSPFWKFLTLVTLQSSSKEDEAEDTHSYSWDDSCDPELMQEKQSSHEENQTNAVNMRRLLSYANNVEELKNSLVSLSAKCQYLKTNSAHNQECAAGLQGDKAITELQINLNKSIEQNKQWVEHDQQREADVKAMLTRMTWLEKHLQDISKARVAERNEYISDEKKKLKQMEKYYDGLVHEGSKELHILREQVFLTQQALTDAHRQLREKQQELEEARQQMQSARESQGPPDVTEAEDCLTVQAEDLQVQLTKEKRKSTTLELQIEYLVQDLRDERENCSYLKQQLESVQSETEKGDTEKADNPEHKPAQPCDLPPRPARHRSPYESLLDKSLLECPMCLAAYPVSQNKELLEHLDYCQH